MSDLFDGTLPKLRKALWSGHVCAAIKSDAEALNTNRYRNDFQRNKPLHYTVQAIAYIWPTNLDDLDAAQRREALEHKANDIKASLLQRRSETNRGQGDVTVVANSHIEIRRKKAYASAAARDSDGVPLLESWRDYALNSLFPHNNVSLSQTNDAFVTLCLSPLTLTRQDSNYRADLTIWAKGSSPEQRDKALCQAQNMLQSNIRPNSNFAPTITLHRNPEGDYLTCSLQLDSAVEARGLRDSVLALLQAQGQNFGAHPIAAPLPDWIIRKMADSNPRQR